MNKLLIAAASLVVLQGTASAQAAPDTGWYIGGALGASSLKPTVESSKTKLNGKQDTHSTGMKILGGYQFNANWAAEAQYQDLGKWKYTEPTRKGSANVTGLSLAAVGRLPVGEGFALIGKLGLVRQSFDASAVNLVNGSTASLKINKVTPLVGFGAEYALTPAMTLRAEYEYFGVPTLAQQGNDRLKAHTALLSVGMRYRF